VGSDHLGNPPEWDLGIQVFDEAFADAQPYDVLDATKLIPEEIVPLTIVGRLVLDRWPDNFFAETEQVAFLPSNVIPGIDFSDDPLLQGRLFSYLDTQKSRLGTANFHQIPVNAPKCPFQNFQRDGMMQTQVFKGRANYEPNSLGEAGEDGGPRESPQAGFTSVGRVELDVDPAPKLRIRADRFADHYSQARLFYRSQTRIEQAHIASALVFELSKVALEHVRQRVVANLRNVDEDLASRVADGPRHAAASGVDAGGRADRHGSFPGAVHRRQDEAHARRPQSRHPVRRRIRQGGDRPREASVEKAGGAAMLIAPKVGGVKVKGRHAQGGRPARGDAVGSLRCGRAGPHRDAAAKLAEEGAAVDFVRDAFGHLKAIGCSPDVEPLLQKAGVARDSEGVTGLDDKFVSAAGRRFFDREPTVRTLA
jgi:catalase